MISHSLGLPGRGGAMISLCILHRKASAPQYRATESIPIKMTLSQTNSASASAIGQEQSYLDMLYRLLDEARDRTERGLPRTLGSGGAGGTFQARVERDFTAAEQSRRLAQLNAVEHGLCFGRTDSEPTADRAGTLYIGRIGLRDDEHEPRLIDWRAPAAHPFYARPPSARNGLIRRRHIYTRNRTVTGVDDEVFDLDRLSEPDRRALSGEAMLIASITSRRTGRMSDVVGTIPAGQDQPDRQHPRPPHRPDERRGGDHPGRAGPGHPLRPAGRAGRAGRPRHGQDRRGAAPGRVPALHPPAHARAARRACHRAERHLPPLH